MTIALIILFGIKKKETNDLQFKFIQQKRWMKNGLRIMNKNPKGLLNIL